MGSSAKKKKEKKKDFQKPKHKVGKAAPKASNFTDTSFKSKSIVMGQQSLSTTAPDVIQQFKHNLSLASSSRSDKQRKDALAYLTSQLSSHPPVNPVGTYGVLAKLLPLISDSSTPVRSQLLKLMKELPEDEVKNCVEQTIMFVRAGMTHLSADVSNDSLSVIEWLLDVADEEIVACPGGWVKTLSTFCAVMGWPLNTTKSGWSSAPRPSLRAKDATTQARQIAALSRFLRAGLRPEVAEDDDEMEYLDSLYRMPRASNTFEYLNLTGARRDEESEMYLSREARQGVFYRRFFSVIEKQVEQAKKEGGAMGRAAANLDEALTEGMGDYMPSTAMDTQDLLELW